MNDDALPGPDAPLTAEPALRHPMRDSVEDRETVAQIPVTPQTQAPSYRLAFADEDFLLREELRPVRLQLELLKPQLMLDEAGVETTVVLFGGARIPDAAHAGQARTPTLAALSKYYEEARRFAYLVTEASLFESRGRRAVIATGGGPGVMEAGNRGAQDAGGRSVGLNIVLPHEQAPNAYVTPDLCFNFHYFAIRKMHFLMRAEAVCVFPGGFGTLDEMFEALTLIQTGRMAKVPFLLFGKDFWERIIDWQALAEAGTIAAEDLDLFRYVETADEAMEAMRTWSGRGRKRDQIPGRTADAPRPGMPDQPGDGS
ncbi:TIGR00730 family Rossman fold protein [Rubellimicrobium roseum]|uniref:AMP nucleosidase n=1 Tax=Rubellimicrobium roseum TaxID=687525 RepID=A0A5C4NJ50_9RHOB|nr:TIGR00730 family Rossman fold protein [Rubellimicrobium roseum]TNC74132.1 TIGR00730 family Rossman fold protein [Rubellimicrobium roseum]